MRSVVLGSFAEASGIGIGDEAGARVPPEITLERAGAASQEEEEEGTQEFRRRGATTAGEMAERRSSPSFSLVAPFCCLLPSLFVVCCRVVVCCSLGSLSLSVLSGPAALRHQLWRPGSVAICDSPEDPPVCTQRLLRRMESLGQRYRPCVKLGRGLCWSSVTTTHRRPMVPQGS